MTDAEQKPMEETSGSAGPSEAPVVPESAAGGSHFAESAAAPTVGASGSPDTVAEPMRRQSPAGLQWGTGRRKSAVARVRILPGSGDFQVNRRPVEQYFTEPQDRNDACAPLDLTGVRKNVDVFVNVNGGGHTGQAGAIRLGVARALVKSYQQYEATLRDSGFLTRDARRVERKKPGQRKARRRFQFSKR